MNNLVGSSDYVPVGQIYHDRSVFVTGGTGFIGKVLVEKLLRSCPGIKNIYLLMRPKRGHDVSTRLCDLLDAPVFDQLRKERPMELNKIVPIQGDITEPEFGINQTDQILLIRTVSVVFHCAATVKFDEALKIAVTINTLGTKRLVELCLRMQGLEALIHVSTAYCNCDREEVTEVIYPPPYDPENIIQCMEWMDDDLIEALTPKLIGNRPNTYTFTKALAENILLRESANLPVAIVRPSIVLSSLREPVAGWVENLNGATGLLAAAGKGVLRTILCGGSNIADLVPVDILINLTICAAWKTATCRPDGIAVYNCCTGQEKPITWIEFVELSFVYMRKHPLCDVIWYPDIRLQSSLVLNSLCTYTLQIIPAHVLDFFSRIVGKKPIMVLMQNKLDKALKCLDYFTTHQWRFTDENVRHLNGLLSPEDRRVFHFDVREIHWPTCIENYVLGIRHFIFKEHPSSLPKSRKRLQKLLWLHRFTQLLVLLLVWRALMLCSKAARKMRFTMLDMVLFLARKIPYV